MEATGNEGSTVDRWYQWTALLVWPQKWRVVVEGLDKVIQRMKSDAANQKWDRDLAKEVVAQSSGAIKPSPLCSDLLLQCLMKFLNLNFHFSF